MGSGATRPTRTGASVVEFDVVMALVLLVVGAAGFEAWRAWRAEVIAAALREGVAAGAATSPRTYERGTCADCLAVADREARAALGSRGIALELNASLERIPTAGATCAYAVVLAPDPESASLVPFVTGPSAVALRVASVAAKVPCT